MIENETFEEPAYEEPVYEEPVYEEPSALAPDLNSLAYNAAVFRDEVVNMYSMTAYGLSSGDAANHHDHDHVSFN